MHIYYIIFFTRLQSYSVNTFTFFNGLFLCLLLPNIWGAEMWFWGLDKARFLSYNTTPAEEEKPLRWEFASLLSKAFDHMAWPRGFGCFWPHISIGCFRADHIAFFSVCFLLAAATAHLILWSIFRWPLVLFRGASFDHILDHSAEWTTWKQ